MPLKKQPPAEIYIIVLHYNQYALTRDCLLSLNTLDIAPSHRVVVVDNASTDGSLSRLIKEFPHTTFIKNPANLGFAAANNKAISFALKHRASAVLLVNNDTLFTDPRILYKLSSSPFSIAAPVVTYATRGKTLFDYGGRLDLILGRNTHDVRTGYSPIDHPCDYVSGVAMFIRSEVLHRVGLLDPGYFFYYEDADFCLRARKAGFTVGVVGGTKIFHHLSASVNAVSGQKLSWLIQSHRRFISRHIRFPLLLLALAYHHYLKSKLK